MIKSAKKGDKVKLTFYNPNVLSSEKHIPQIGDTGIVLEVKHVKNLFNYGKGYHQIWVRWSNGQEFGLIHEQDVYEVLL